MYNFASIRANKFIIFAMVFIINLHFYIFTFDLFEWAKTHGLLNIFDFSQFFLFLLNFVNLIFMHCIGLNWRTFHYRIMILFMLFYVMQWCATTYFLTHMKPLFLVHGWIFPIFLLCITRAWCNTFNHS